MSDDTTGITRRTAIEATGAAFAVGVGAAGSASAHCPSCDEDSDVFCGSECVETVVDAEAYDKCPFDALSYVTTIQAGRTGFIWDTCTDGCEQAVKVRFDCSDTFWIDSSDLDVASDCTC